MQISLDYKGEISKMGRYFTQWHVNFGGLGPFHANF